MEKINKFSLKFNKIYHYLFKESFDKKINFHFPENIKRWDLVNQVIENKKFSSYLEIGCDDDLLFSKVNLINKIGVDPHSGGNYRATSDDFFLKNKQKFDCVFIDGLHEFDQVSKDIENSINFLNDNGIILIHDCLPSNIHQQAVPRYKLTWTGDVWKAIVKYRTRIDLDVITCNIDFGVSIIRKKKNSSILKIDCRDFKKLKFKDFFYNYQIYMRILNFEDTLKYIKLL